MTTSLPSNTEVKSFLGEDAFQNEQSRRLFEAIDELRSSGANRDIELPELVIVGDQSAGKSSLLQSLTDIPFPVASRLCTRFPIRIVSRRTLGSSESTRVSIEPKVFSAFADGQSPEQQRNYGSFHRDSPNMSPAEFKDIIEEATDLMGIKRSHTDAAESRRLEQNVSRNFSDDVLKIEISGPDRSHFSILDVPGVFQSLTKNLTDNEKTGVKSMVESYMESKQSIIICVANGTNDPANQAVFDMVSRWDKHGERTVGVITKCDITPDVEQVMDLALNKEKIFHHGWFVVRNRTPFEVEKEIGGLERYDKEQAFFNSSPWNTLSDTRRGTQALKVYLADLLCLRIKKAFPTYLEDIQRLLDSAEWSLTLLGKARATLGQKRSYLMNIAHDFENLVKQCLQGRYESIHSEMLKLRMRVRKANDAFALDMKKNGHSVPFIENIETEDRGERLGRVIAQVDNSTAFATFQPEKKVGSFKTNVCNSKTGTPCPGTTATQFQPHTEQDGSRLIGYQSISAVEPYRAYSFEELRLSDYHQSGSPSSKRHRVPGAKVVNHTTPSSDQRKQEPPKSIFDITSKPIQSSTRGLFGNSWGFPTNQTSNEVWESTPPVRTPPLIYQWIRDEIKASRGTELQGTLNPNVLPALFHNQVSKWRTLSGLHVRSVVMFIVDALIQMLKTACPDATTMSKIEPVIRNASEESLKRALDHLSWRVDQILSRHLQTNNPAFEQKISEARRIRFHSALERYRKSKIDSVEGNENETELQLVIDMRDTTSLFNELHFSNSQNLEDEIHDILKAYYEIQRDNFVDSVIDLIVEPFLEDPHGPVHIFTQKYVGNLSDEQIESLGAEDEALIRDRTAKEEAFNRLTRAKETAQRYSSEDSVAALPPA